MDDALPVLELVGGGLAEWPSGQGPRGETIAAAAFVDATAHPSIAELPHRFHEAGESWRCEASLHGEPPSLMVRITAPLELAFRAPVDVVRHGPLLGAIRRDGGLYLCPTTVRLGLNARLARDHSFYCAFVAPAAS